MSCNTSKILWFPGNKIESVLPKQLPDLLHDLGCWGGSQQGPALAELEAQVVIIMTMNMFLGHDLIFRFLALRGSEIFIFERPPLTSEVMFQMFIFHQTLKLNDFLKDWSGGEGAGSVLQYKVNMITMWRRLMWRWDWWSWRHGRQWGWIYQSGHADAAIINIVSSTSLCNSADADVDDASCYWWHYLLQVFEAMFRVIKESEYVDERQHCFLIQVNLTRMEPWIKPRSSIVLIFTRNSALDS